MPARSALRRERSFLCAVALSFVCVSSFGWANAGGLGDGLKVAWYSNAYSWDYFVVAIVSSVAGVGAGAFWESARGGDALLRDRQRLVGGPEDPKSAPPALMGIKGVDKEEECTVAVI